MRSVYDKLGLFMESESRKQSRFSLWLLGIFVLVLLGFLLILQSSNIWKSFSVETAGDTLLLYGLTSLNFAAFVIFGFIFLRSILRLARERRALQLGAKIKTRLLFYFVLVSLLPITAMAVFSYLFLNRALDRWFSQIPENVVHETRSVQLRMLAEQQRRLSETADMLAASLSKQEIDSDLLNKMADAGNLAFIEVLDSNGKTLLSSSKNQAVIPNLEWAAINEGRLDDPILRDGSGLDIAVAGLSDGRRLVIVPEYGSADSAERIVDRSLSEFDRLKEQQITVRHIGFLTLGVLTFLLIFASSWTAFYLARGIAVPIKALAEGSERIARGELGYKVDVPAEDELALLVASFNEMSAKLAENSAALAERRRYIETVLLSLPTGVVSLDGEDRITTINPAARKILNIRQDLRGKNFFDCLDETGRAAFLKIIRRAKRVGHSSDQIELGFGGGVSTLPVAITATALPEESGVVLVLEDLSELLAAQRAAAWQEVARRMAHEIKNPLTPIQLSAERIRRRYSSLHNSSLDSTAEVIESGTATILREVASLKTMVDEFSQFARLPSAKPEPGDLNETIRNVGEIYRDREGGIEIKLDLQTDLPTHNFDPEQIKRALVNLIENAIESYEETVRHKPVMISSLLDQAGERIIIRVTDYGRGIAPENYAKLFQPYFSTKGRGTGLGLAIVRRIITEHFGRIYARGNEAGGSDFIIELPLNT
jgi:nitrogen fixation/metabolism regulation signal transduction histidine kinase